MHGHLDIKNLFVLYTYVGLFVTKYQIHKKELLNFILDVCNKKQNKTNVITYCYLQYIIRVTVINKGTLPVLYWNSVAKANIRTTDITQDPPGPRHDGHRIIHISGGRIYSFCLCLLL